jgi:cytochrome c oxidase assembly protein subunit 15
MLLGRDLVFYTSTVRVVNASVFLLAAALVVGAAVLARRARGDERTGAVVSSD